MSFAGGFAVNVMNVLNSTELIAAIVGSIVGSLTSGWISYRLQKSATDEARNDRKAGEKTEQQSIAYSLAFKVLAITNNLANIRRHVEGELANRHLVDDRFPMTYLKAMLNTPRSVELVPTEMSLLLAQGDDQLFNDVFEIELIYNSILPVWAQYQALRDEVNQFAGPEGLDHATGKGTFEVKRGTPAEVMFLQANQTAVDLIRRSQQDLDEARATLDRLLKLLREKFGIKLDAKIEL